MESSRDESHELTEVVPFEFIDGNKLSRHRTNGVDVQQQGLHSKGAGTNNLAILSSARPESRPMSTLRTSCLALSENGPGLLRLPRAWKIVPKNPRFGSACENRENFYVLKTYVLQGGTAELTSRATDRTM